MKLVLHNLTYHDGPVQVREKAIFAPERSRALGRRMRAIESVGTIFFCTSESTVKEI